MRRNVTLEVLSWLGFVLAACLFFAAVFPAWATVAAPDGDTGLRIDLSEPVAWAIGALGTVASALIASIMGVLPGHARWAAKLLQIDQVLNAVILSWVSKNAEKISSKASWTVDLRNTAVRDMVGLALNTGNKFVVKARETLLDKLHARLQTYIEKEYGNKTG